MPGVIGDGAYNIRMCLLGLAIDRVDILDKKNDLNSAATLSRREQACTLGFPVWRIVSC